MGRIRSSILPRRRLQWHAALYPGRGFPEFPVLAEQRTYSIAASVETQVSSGGIQFVDTLPGLGPENANNLGQYIPVAVPDTESYPGSDYYEIALVQYAEQMHTNLPKTLLRGYVQLSTSVVPGAGSRWSSPTASPRSTFRWNRRSWSTLPLPGPGDLRAEGPARADQVPQPAPSPRRRNPSSRSTRP